MLCAAFALGLGTAQAAPKPTERSKQKAALEATRAAVQQKLGALKRDISRTESEKENAADTLAESEEAISDANRSLRELGEEQAQTNARLAELSAARDTLSKTVEAQKAQLAKLLRQHYVAGNEERIKLLLSGENPNRINRDLQLLAYVSQAQAKLLAALRANLAALEANTAQAQNAKDELEEIAQEQRDQKALLEKEKARRAALLGTLSKRLVDQRKEAGTLERDEQRMSDLVDKLAKLMKEQAEAAAAEKARREALAAARAKAKAEALAKAQAQAEAEAKAAAAAKAERERLARLAASKPGAKPEPKPPTPVEPPKVVHKAEPMPVAPVKDEPDDGGGANPADVALAPAVPDGVFAALRGQLRPPLVGKILARFGAKRGDAPNWKGVYIKAAEGSEVRALAAGRVAFAGWLRGWGNVIIIDHGGGYLCIYGYNQAVLRRAGDAVKGGDVVASAGNSGGNEESGLYFELRHKGTPFDPAAWIKF